MSSQHSPNRNLPHVVGVRDVSHIIVGRPVVHVCIVRVCASAAAADAVKRVETSIRDQVERMAVYVVELKYSTATPPEKRC